ncbi:exosome complex component RRP42-like [Stegodyphus dumicola]|uniref:exosome complex component RRP42-like n=1 Tax=Stegodyphus dumicola TaxID=202533 RepID=UPI0015B2F28D|nr:exosome complex component RRP42-like [Stegodyphus dumicola]
MIPKVLSVDACVRQRSLSMCCIEMANVTLQEAEKVFIIHGVQENFRGDGRSCFDYRMVELETGVIANCNGSALVKLAETKLLAGVKAELTTPPPNVPNRGWIEVSIESTPHAHLDFEGRGGDDFAADVSQILMQSCNNEKLIDMKSLCVIPGQQVWVLYVDILVLGYSGNLIDAASIATKAALYDTKIQTVNVKHGENEPEIEVSDDPYDVFSLDVSNLPLLITLFRVGSEFIVDATSEEEACSKCKLVLAVSLTDTVLLKQISGPGCLHLESIKDSTEAGQELGLALQKKLLEVLQLEKNVAQKTKCLM